METGAADWAFSCGQCHVGGGQLEYDRDRNDYGSAGEGTGDKYYYKPPTLDAPAGGITLTNMSATNKAEVDCLLCHINDGSGISGNGRAFLQSMECATGGAAIFGTAVQLGPKNDPNCGYALNADGTDSAPTDPAMMGRNGAGPYVSGTKYDSFNRTLAVQAQQFNYAAAMGLGATATLSMAADGGMHIDGLTNAPTAVANSMIAATPSSQNCSVCHGRDDNTPGLPGMLNPVRYGYGIYLIINPQATTLDVDPGTQLADGSNDTRWMEMGCKTGMGKRGHKTGAGPNDKWGMSMFSAMFGLGIGPGTPITTASYDTGTPMGDLHTTAKMPDQDVHDASGMQCATCHYALGSSTLEGGSKTIEAATEHGVAYPEETILGIDHNFAQGDSLKDNYGRNALDGTVSCEGCHTTRTHPNLSDNGGGLTSPTPAHAGFPAVHLEKIGCTTCHIPEIYVQPFKLKYRDFTVGKFKRGTETAGGNKNIYDFSYNFVTDSGDSTKQLYQWATKYGEKKIYPVTPIEVNNWVNVINNGATTSTDVIAGTTPPSNTLDYANNNNTTIVNLSTEPNAIKTCTSGIKVGWSCSTDADCPGFNSFPDNDYGSAGVTGACAAGNAVKTTIALGRDVIEIAAATLADCATDPTGAFCSSRINGGSMVPVFDNWVLTDNLSTDTIAKRNAMRAKSLTLFSDDSSKHLKMEKIFHAAFDETHGVAPKAWALGATERGGCAMCHSSANTMSPNYSPYSVGFFEGLMPYTERANQFVPAANAPLSDQLVPAIGNMFVGKFDLMKNPMAMFADFDCAQTFCGVGTCGGADCSTVASPYNNPSAPYQDTVGLDMLGAMMVNAGVMNKATALSYGLALTSDSYYFNQMTNDLNNPDAACSPYSPLYDLTPMGMPGMGITTIGQCTDLMNAGFDAMMGLPHSVGAVGAPDDGYIYSTAGMMGFSDGIAGLQGMLLRETQDGTNMSCNPMAGMKTQANMLGFPVNLNNCMPNPDFYVPFDQGSTCTALACVGGMMHDAPCTADAQCNIMPIGYLFAGTCTGGDVDGPGNWSASCEGGFRDGHSCAVNADCEGALSSAEAGFQAEKDMFGSLGSLMYTRAQQRTHNKTVLQSNGPTDLTWPIAGEKNPGNAAHMAAWDQAAICLTNYGFMGPEVPCGTTGTGYCTGQDGTSADKCVNVKTYISSNDLLGYTPTKLAALQNFNNCTACHAAPNHPVNDSDVRYPTCTSCHTTQHDGVQETTAAVCNDCHQSGPEVTFTAGQTAVLAENFHNTIPRTASFTATASATVSKQVDFVATGCPATTTCTYDWNFGDGNVETVDTAGTTHDYASAGSYVAVVTITSSDESVQMSPVKSVTVTTINTPPTPTKTVSVAGFVVTIVDSSSDTESAQADLDVTVGCGSGGVRNPVAAPVAGGTTVTCTYTTAGTRYITQKVTDPDGATANAASVSVYVPTKYTVKGKVTRLNGTTAISGVVLYLKVGSSNKYSAVSNSLGNFTFSNVIPGTYNVKAVKSGYTFTDPEITDLVVDGNEIDVNFSSNNL
jgi:hypothetical protein